MTLQRNFRTAGFAVTIAAFTLAGCAGGGAALPSLTGHSVTSARTAKASFTIHWPAHAIASPKSANRARSQYISPSALAVVVEVNPNAATPGPITFANANGAQTSTVTIDAPVGNDEFVFTLWDTQQTAGETQAVGNLLGQADVASQTIVAGQVNTVNATIGGITSRISIAPIAGQAFVETDPTIGYDLVGDLPATFAATAYDAGGNVIVSPGAPSLSFAASSGSAGFISVQPVSANPNQFTVAALTAKASASPYGAVVTATDSGVQHTYTANLNVFLRSAVYVSYGTGAGSRIAMYDDHGNVMPLRAGAFSGLTSPAGLAYSSKEHRLFVADNGANKVLAFDASGNAASGFSPPTLAGARAIEYDSQSDAVFATGTSQTIAFNPDGTPKALVTGAFSQTTSPDGIAYVGADPNYNPYDAVAVANDATASIDYYDARTGAYLATTDALGAPAAAPIVGLAWNMASPGHPLLVAAGGGAGAGFGLTTIPGSGGSIFDNVTSTTSRFAGVAFASTIAHDATATSNATQYEAFVVQTDANQIQGYIRDPYSDQIFPSPDVLISTPAASGLSMPLGIAVAI